MVLLKLIKNIFGIYQLIILYFILIQFCIGIIIKSNNNNNNQQRLISSNYSPIHKINIRSSLKEEEQNTKILKYNSNNDGLFREYISGGLFNCGTKYVAMLQKLNKFIENIHQEFSICKKQMNQVDKTPFSEQFQIIDDLFGNKEN